MRWLSLLTAAVLAGSAACSVVPRQNQFVGYLVSTFSDANPRIQWYLSNGNSPTSYRRVNNGNPILASTVGTKAVRDIFLATNAARSEYFLIATGKLQTTQSSHGSANRHQILTSMLRDSTGTKLLEPEVAVLLSGNLPT
jgi:hypothetical protein